MAERKTEVFVVATANDIQALPPELVRKGRFDEIFFVDLPKPDTRAAILGIHLTKRGLPLANFNIEALAGAMEGFSGAEIEQAIVAALYASHAKQESLETAHCSRLEIACFIELYRDRAAGFRKNPPPAGWDGVYTAVTK